MSPASVTLEGALKLLALPRPVAVHPETKEPILAGIGRFGPYVQHGRTYANLGSDDDVLEIGANRAIDLIVAKESGRGGGGRGAADPGRALGDDPASGKPIVVKAGRFGPYVTDGKTNATIPKSSSADAVTLDEALALLAERRTKGGGKPASRAKARGGKAPAKSAAKAPAKSAAAKAPARAKAAPKVGAKATAAKSTAAKAAGAKRAKAE
jgi:DNA topoisomerase-1